MYKLDTTDISDAASYIVNCHITQRKGEKSPLFQGETEYNKYFIVRLDNYVVMPREDWEALEVKAEELEAKLHELKLKIYALENDLSL